ncbi:MAG: hypothetical protein EZS28_042343 [Streblomastix strix]|uniref:Uncharacterized protein n=1 Tax=Streblomastix strix TaxID=222440 RepID=A0A5J4TVR9_9EUKA|nr:MAG: hypothetical protein EZS28_042343 [Streblomastix strix]
MIQFMVNGTDQVKDLIKKGEWTTCLDQKSAFHLPIADPPHRPYLASEAMGKVQKQSAKRQCTKILEVKIFRIKITAFVHVKCL